MRPGEAFLGWLTLGHFLLMAILWLFYDRYALVVLPSVIGLLLTGERSPRPALALVFLVVFGGVSFVGVHDHLQYNQALWQAVDTLQERGIPDSDIDGGYVVNGWLHYAHPENAPQDEQGNILVPGLTTKMNPLRYLIANRPLPNWRVVQTIPYHRWWGRSGIICILERDTAPPLPVKEITQANSNPIGPIAINVKNLRTGKCEPRSSLALLPGRHSRKLYSCV
jgi:hypothetical protein